ncbi:GNAT family N-acetyltransferase [Bordetella genomosp. 13]|uniref:GNAT family N-acetyltransferase n=1 Tax=Bordetella genomosp. 13 TaxID=463040 RepID=UPI00119D7578|nr:GNAT family N-acetyltransferase [Bordetella genomosp. 13]
MSEATIRPATASDLPAIQSVVNDAYSRYIPRMGRPPAPMSADYADLVARGAAWVLVQDGGVAGLIVLRANEDGLLVSNVAVSSAHQGRGLGRRLLDHAEAHARQNGIDELRLYTHVLMHENVAIYTRLGWQEYDRAEQDGFNRIFMRKRLPPAATA